MLRITLLAGLLAVTSLSHAENDIPMIPVVSAQKAKANLAPPPPKKDSGKKSEPAKAHTPGVVNLDKSHITMQSGVNEIVQVAVSHLNRIVTPYDNPKVTTSSQATTEVRDNVVYIGTTNESPLTLFITEMGSEEQALSLTLIPKKIPPREIFLNLPKTQGNEIRVTKKAAKWEKSQPYLITIESLLKGLALGELPSGYSFLKVASGVLPVCRQTGIEFDFKAGQTVTGHNLVVHIGVAKNTSPEPIEFVEDTCGAWDVAAVAAYPRNALEPGEMTEIYVAKKKHYRKEIKVDRPSLLRGGK